MEVTKPPAINPYRPWMTNLSWIGYSLVVMIAAWFFLYQHGKTDEFFAISFVGGPIVVANLHFLKARVHGQLVERKAIRQLEKIDRTRVIKNKPLPGRGDIDVIFKGKTETYNVEIKSVQDANKVSRKHLKQALEASDYLHSLPVIWLPKAPERKIINRGGVTIFGGTAKQLYSYLI